MSWQLFHPDIFDFMSTKNIYMNFSLEIKKMCS